MTRSSCYPVAQILCGTSRGSTKQKICKAAHDCGKVSVKVVHICTLVGRKLQLPASSQIWPYTMYNAHIKLKWNSAL